MATPKGKIQGSGNTEVIQDLMNFSTKGAGKLIEQTTETKQAGIKEGKKSVCFQLNESTKKALEEYKNKYDMTLAGAIKKAIREMLERENLM